MNKGISEFPLKNAEDLYNAFVQAPVAMCIFRGQDSIIDFANDFYLKLIGRQTDILGTSLYESFPELINQGLKELIEGVIKKGNPFYIHEHEMEISRNAVDEIRFFNCSYQPFRERNGQILSTIVVFTEITEQVKLRNLSSENQKRLSIDLENAKSELIFQKVEKGKRAEELGIANIELAFQDDEKEKRAEELNIANIELAFQDDEKEKRADELIIANKELLFQNKEKEKRAAELIIANEELLFQNNEKEKRAEELSIANIELAFQNNEKEKRAEELSIANIELAFQNNEKEKRAEELSIANIELAFQNNEKEKRAEELSIANIELAFQNNEKEKRATELGIANIELAFQNNEKEKRAEELSIANIELAFQNNEKEKRATELGIANIELAFQNDEKEKRAEELSIANIELAFQNDEKEKRAEELSIANIELAFQNDEKEKRADELSIANIELAFQNDEKEKRADELGIANIELAFQNDEKEKRAAELLIANYSRILIEASLDPLVTINNEGKITDMNEALTHITGSSREALIDTYFKDYFTDPQKAHEVYLEVFAKGFVKDFPLTMKDHKLTDVLFNGSVYNDEHGNVKGVVIVARDVTDQKRIKKELVDSKIFAEEAQGKAEIATELAVNAVKAKQQFLSNMSHEIRTPMNAIIGFTKVILKTDLSAKQKEYLSAIKISGDALIVLINDILDLAKVDAGKMSFESTPFKLRVSIAAMLHIFEPKIQEKNLALITEYDPEIPEFIAGDPVRLHQIIMNLVSNSVKFTSDGSITVKVVLLNNDDEKVKIGFYIKDTGIGITEDKMGRIFENFQQASSGTSRLYGGTGLGLAIVKQLIERQEGSIEVESTLGEGSTFSFILDFKKTEGNLEEVIEMAKLDKEIKNIKVLVVEDMPLNQLLMKTLLDDFGFERDIAANGKLAVERMQTKIYDIVLMDLQMPEMNGFEATEYIRNVLKSDIPILALTADVTTVDVAKCRAVGMNDYIAKPVDERLLYSKIISLVKKVVSLKKAEIEKVRYTDLSYLNQRTKSDPALMMEMITLYLEQTPHLILTMKQSLQDKDWGMLGNTVHKMIPSFSIVGFNPDYEKIAKQIQEYAKSQELAYEINDLVAELENACGQACEELNEELVMIQNSKIVN